MSMAKATSWINAKPLQEAIEQFVGDMVERHTPFTNMEYFDREVAPKFTAKKTQGLRWFKAYFARRPWDASSLLKISERRPILEQALFQATSNMPPITLDELIECAIDQLVVSHLQFRSECDEDHDVEGDALLELLLQKREESERAAQGRFALALRRRVHWRGYETDAMDLGVDSSHLKLSKPVCWPLANGLTLVLFTEELARSRGTGVHTAHIGLDGECSAAARSAILVQAAGLFRLLLPSLKQGKPKSNRKVSDNMLHRLLDPVEDLLKVYFSTPSKKDRPIQNAAVLMSESATQSNPAIALALNVAALEALLGGGAKDEISEKVARRAAVMFAPKAVQRPRVKSAVKRLYKFRSDVLHGTSLETDEGLLQTARVLAVSSLRAVLQWRASAIKSDLPAELDRLADTGELHPLTAEWSKYISDTVWGSDEGK